MDLKVSSPGDVSLLLMRQVSRNPLGSPTLHYAHFILSYTTKEIITKGELEFTVLSDVGNTVARGYHLVFTLPEVLRPYTANLPQYNGDDSWEIPLPGTFIISPDGIVQLAFIHADYTKRLEPSHIINVLQQIV